MLTLRGTFLSLASIGWEVNGSAEYSVHEYYTRSSDEYAGEKTVASGICVSGQISPFRTFQAYDRAKRPGPLDSTAQGYSMRRGCDMGLSAIDRRETRGMQQKKPDTVAARCFP